LSGTISFFVSIGSIVLDCLNGVLNEGSLPMPYFRNFLIAAYQLSWSFKTSGFGPGLAFG